jgi:hypothetical protein
MRNSSIEKLKEINLTSFSSILENGFQLVKDEMSVTNLEEQTGNFLCIYESETRKLSISYNFNISNNNQLIESTWYKIQAKNIDSDNLLDVSQYLRIKRKDDFDQMFNLFNDSNFGGIKLSEYEEKVNHYSNYIFKELTNVIFGLDWISASHTRLDGFKIIENGKTEYIN